MMLSILNVFVADKPLKIICTALVEVLKDQVKGVFKLKRRIQDVGFISAFKHSLNKTSLKFLAFT
ncbi:hypothetical protein QTP88_021297 [Uroleucon formosanum]